MKSVELPIDVTLYLTGNLNSGFQQLKNATVHLLDELKIYPQRRMNVEIFDPNNATGNTERETNYLLMKQRGMQPTRVYEKDKDGKRVQKMIFPWVEITYNGKTTAVNLLKNNPMLSGEENLNNSIEELEFELTDAIRRLTNRNVEKIAFLEGHGELNEYETLDITRTLSRYFQIDRGTIGTDPTILDEYKCVIVAKPTKPFSKQDKFVLDQYLMQGGSLLWLVDGVQLSEEALAENGTSPVIPLDLNLNDLFFHYGVRINPFLLEDKQAVLVPINVAPKGENAHYEPMTWAYSPLLLPVQQTAIAKNISLVKANYASVVEPVGNDRNIRKTPLLVSSTQSNLLQTPAIIAMANLSDFAELDHFKLKHIPAGMLLEGNFTSLFNNRMIPKNIDATYKPILLGKKARQVVIADGDIIKNDTQQTGDSVIALPLGYDRYMNRQFGNNQLITNTILYLTDQAGWMQLRQRTIPLRLLNQERVVGKKTQWQLLSVALPLLLLIMIGILLHVVRKRKYER